MLSWKNRLILYVVSRFRPSFDPQVPIKRILIVSTTAIGDTLWATPAIANLRRHFPQAHIAVLTSLAGEQVLSHNHHVDVLYTLKEPVLLRFFSLFKKLKQEHFDVALILHASQRLVLPLCALSIPRIIGTRKINKGLDDLLTDPVEMLSEHEIERRLKILDRIMVPRSSSTLSYYVQPQEREEACRFIGTSKQKRIAFHPGSKEAFRRWPPGCFAEVGRALQQTFDCEIFLTGTRTEEPILYKIRQQLPNARIVSSSSIRFLGAFLEQMDLVLSNDTGPFHLACALNRLAIGLYVSTNPSLCGPYLAPRAIAISAEPTCTPCLKRRCRDPFCFLQISPEQVIDACKKLLK
jgi:lipopolysaccharide heptosyltransferase II